MNRGRTSNRLDERLEELESRIINVVDTYQIRKNARFGSRQISLHLLAESHAFEALILCSDADQLENLQVKIFELTPQQFDDLKLEGTTPLSAYDAIQLGSSNEWKLIFSPGVRAVFTYNSKTRNGFFFGLSAASERAKGEVFRHLAHWVSIEDGNFLVHAASLTRGTQALVVAGNAGAGKSSLIIQGLENGYQFQGDNVIEIMKSGETKFHSFGVYRTLKRRLSSSLGEPPHSSRSFDSSIEKDIFYVENERFAIGAREVVKVLYLDPETVNAQQLRSRDLFFLLGPNSIGQFPLYEGALLSRIRDFAERVTAIRSPRMSNLQVGEMLRGNLVE
jgi:hypothetical protein